MAVGLTTPFSKVDDSEKNGDDAEEAGFGREKEGAKVGLLDRLVVQVPFVDFGANVDDDRKVGRVSLVLFRVVGTFFLGSTVVLLVSGVHLLVNNDDVTALSLASVKKGLADIVVDGFLDAMLVSLVTDAFVKEGLEEDSFSSSVFSVEDIRVWYVCFAGVEPLNGLTEKFFGVFVDVVVASSPSTGKTSGLFLEVGWIVE